MDTKNDQDRFTFRAVEKTDRALIHAWMNQKYVSEWIHGDGLTRTLNDLDSFFLGASTFHHWLAYEDRIPFGYLLTSDVKKESDDEYAPFCKKEGIAITLDVVIGNPQYLGKGLAHQMIQEFLLAQFLHVQEVLIDPEVANQKAIHVYEKAGFSILRKFAPSHSAKVHYIMRLDMAVLKQSPKKCLSRYVQSQGLKLLCEAIGNPSNPSVLLICGAGAHAHFWTDPFCNTLVRKGYQVIRFDHRDSGLSSAVNFEKDPYTVADLAEDALAILDAFQIKKAHVVGHSMGGEIAQLLAISHPDRLLSFTSISVATVGEKTSPSKEIMKTLLENKPTQNFEESLEGFMHSWRLLNGDLPLDEEMAKAYTKELYTRSRHPVGVAWNHIRCQEGLPDLSSGLKKVTVPGLFLHGEKDVLIPAEGAIRTANASPSSTLTIIPKMGHMMFHQGVQQQIAKALLQHFVFSDQVHEERFLKEET
jgi:esterase